MMILTSPEEYAVEFIMVLRDKTWRTETHCVPAASCVDLTQLTCWINSFMRIRPQDYMDVIAVTVESTAFG